MTMPLKELRQTTFTWLNIEETRETIWMYLEGATVEKETEEK